MVHLVRFRKSTDAEERNINRENLERCVVVFYYFQHEVFQNYNLISGLDTKLEKMICLRKQKAINMFRKKPFFAFSKLQQPLACCVNNGK